MRAQISSKHISPNGTADAIDTQVVAVMLIRRDVMVEDWSDPWVREFGVKATTWFGLGLLRSNAIAKIINIKIRCRLELLSKSYGCEFEFFAELFWIVDSSSIY